MRNNKLLQNKQFLTQFHKEHGQNNHNERFHKLSTSFCKISSTYEVACNTKNRSHQSQWEQHLAVYNIDAQRGKICREIYNFSRANSLLETDMCYTHEHQHQKDSRTRSIETIIDSHNESQKSDNYLYFTTRVRATIFT